MHVTREIILNPDHPSVKDSIFLGTTNPMIRMGAWIYSGIHIYGDY